MEELNSRQTQMPQTAGNSTVVSILITVFGLLNFVIGGYPLIHTYPKLFNAAVDIFKNNPGKISSSEMLFLGFSFLVGVALSIWLLVLGIGLMRMHKWARCGSVIYAWVAVALFVIAGGYNIIVVGLITKHDYKSYLLAAMSSVVFGLLYPILLLIFMRSKKVKNFFASIGG